MRREGSPREAGVGRIAVAGASGFIGRALVRALDAAGYEPVPLRRPESPPADGAVEWDPDRGTIDAAALEGLEAVVNLAGKGIGDRRWTEAHKTAVLQSRVGSTRLLAGTLAELASPPGVLVNASASGYYGDRGDEVLDESSGPGSGFLAEICIEWEAATRGAAAAGIRVAHLRSGIVLSPEGGALARMLLPFRLGLGGKLGDGSQWWSWISLDDEIAAILHIVRTAELSGPCNLASPNPVRNKEFTETLAGVLRRPAVLAAPRFALRVALGEFADEGLLGSQRMFPRRLEESGFGFAHPELEPALRAVLGRGDAV